jgi:hypothetical protein
MRYFIEGHVLNELPGAEEKPALDVSQTVFIMLYFVGSGFPTPLLEFPNPGVRTPRRIGTSARIVTR